jgi:hypothetical protein
LGSISGLPPSRRFAASDSAGVMSVGGMHVARDPDVQLERARHLVEDRRLVGLPAEAPDLERALGPVGDAPRATGDAVAVQVIGILAREDRRVGDRLEQPHARDRGREAWAQARVLRERAQRQVAHLVLRRAQARELAVGEAERLLVPAHVELALGGDAGDRALAQLLAVPGIREQRPVRFAREPDPEHALVAARPGGRQAAAVADVAARARAPTVVGAEAIELLDRGGGLDPLGAEDAIPQRERGELLVGQVAMCCVNAERPVSRTVACPAGASGGGYPGATATAIALHATEPRIAQRAATTIPCDATRAPLIHRLRSSP